MTSQNLKQQTQLLATIAMQFNGTSKNSRITKRIATIKYQYTKYWFDFSAPIYLEDKTEKDKLSAYATVEMRIDDNLLVITANTKCGRMKVLTQMNVTTIDLQQGRLIIDSPTCHMEC